MHRSAALFFVALVAAVAALLVLRRPTSPSLPTASADGSSAPREVLIVAPSTVAVAPAPVLNSAGLDSAWATRTAEGPASNADAGKTLEDGRPVPPLEPQAPKTLSFGVILVAYRGAEQAPRDARPKEEALALATKLAALAKTDFAAAIEKGDWGAADAGTIQQGVLEPGPERVLFGLAPGETGGPVDSPRGYCIFKRAP